MKDLVIAMTLLVFLIIFPTRADEIAIANTSPLAFGSFAAGNGGTVTVSTSGICSTGGDVILVLQNCAPAGFTVSGDANFTYIIDLPANDFVTLTGPGNDMVISNFTSNPSAADGLIGSGGSQVLSVGGTLGVGSNQAPGSYSGSFTVIVNYN